MSFLKINKVSANFRALNRVSASVGLGETIWDDGLTVWDVVDGVPTTIWDGIWNPVIKKINKSSSNFIKMKNV